MNHVGFAARPAGEVASVRTALQQPGFGVPELQHFGDVTALFMCDPDGIRAAPQPASLGAAVGFAPAGAARAACPGLFSHPVRTLAR